MGGSMTVPAIDETDVVWASKALGLSPEAFCGSDSNDTRPLLIRSMRTLDIEACPGSGKTTLLVAKLAILSRKWTNIRFGLCVLSHTNVARREIETRLGNTAVGQRLLGYPHFVGTIHRFVNEFLSLPWLRSLGYHIQVIDDQKCLRRRWFKLSHRIRSGLTRNRYSEQILRFRDTGFGIGEIRWGNKGTLGEQSETYRAIREACKESVEDGYLCHDEMFIWAHDALDHFPSIASSIRKRFPILFIDEVQDNSELQTELLHRVFFDGDQPVIRQRLGDANQSIYQYPDRRAGVALDSFPISGIRVDMASSYRFDQSIADLVEPLAVEPQGLQGLRRNRIEAAHGIFLFSDDTIGQVLECYAEHLVKTFTASELRGGLFTAIGAVHRSDDDDRVPRSVRHYWPEYDHEINSAETAPSTFVSCITLGSRLAHFSEEAYSMVEAVADGFLRLVYVMRPELRFRIKRRRHQHMLELLALNHSAKDAYLDLVRRLCVDQIPLTRERWDTSWKGTVERIVAACGCAIDNNSAAQRYLAWDTAGPGAVVRAGRARSDNIFRHMVNDIEVSIRVGSIHAAKGETHTSTLVLDTFYRTHHLKSLKAWLSGERRGGANMPASVSSRMRLHYVAMSRPSQLLCLAIREDALTDSDVDRISRRGWRVGRVQHEGTVWIR